MSQLEFLRRQAVVALLSLGSFLVSEAPSFGAVVAAHADPVKASAIYGIGSFFMGQSFTIQGSQPVEISTFSWIDVQRMPESDSLYVFDRPFLGFGSTLDSTAEGLVAVGQLESGGLVYNFQSGTILSNGIKYYAYMSTSLLEDPKPSLPANTVGYFGPADIAYPRSFSGWSPQAPLNWFDSYPDGEAYMVASYLRDGPFFPVSTSSSSVIQWESDFLFSVSGIPIPEPRGAALFVLGFALTILKARERTRRH